MPLLITPTSGIVGYSDYLTFLGNPAPPPSPTGVTAALAAAQGRVEDEIQRPLTYGQYSETLFVYDNGMVYPTVPNLISCDSPANVTVQGRGIYLGYLVPGPAVLAGGWSAAFPPQAPVTYTAGFTAATLPDKLRNAICQVAWRKLNPVVFPGVPVGATEAAIGDAHIATTAGVDGFQVLDASVKAALSGWALRQTRGWQADPVLVGPGA